MDNMQLFLDALKKSVELGKTTVDDLPPELQEQIAVDENKQPETPAENEV